MPRMTTRTDHADDVHTQRKENPDVICPECRKPLKKSSLHGHTKRFHRPEEWLPCDVCEYVAKCKSDQEDHERCHEGRKDFKCEDDPENCREAFCNKANLQHHRERWHDFVPPQRKRRVAHDSQGKLDGEAGGSPRDVRLLRLGHGPVLPSAYGSASSHASSSSTGSTGTPSSVEPELTFDDSASYANPTFDFGTYSDNIGYLNGQATCTTSNFDQGVNPTYPADPMTQCTMVSYQSPDDLTNPLDSANIEVDHSGYGYDYKGYDSIDGYSPQQFEQLIRTQTHIHNDTQDENNGDRYFWPAFEFDAR